LTIALLLATFGCHGGGSSPTEPLTSSGSLHFTDSGCACVQPPYPGIAVYIDGEYRGLLPVFGELSVTLPAGDHTWSTESPNGATTVRIEAGRTTNVRIETNLSCTEGCSDSRVPTPLSSLRDARKRWPAYGARLGRMEACHAT
jgi:hypothetical protein